ncbi:hypothetical protein ACBJ59_10560 [Nonomuraea sp. MTCD27]|uniref:hypothetical protein n=1 Tax=Nonomuraea sp. MTCD27 TaxID=1676747 RepID=UPI0035BFA821
MPVNEKLMELGSWNIELIDETPKTVLDQIAYFGHIAFIPGRVEPAQYGDELLDMARYVGVVMGKSVDHIRKVVSGQGMNVWLADSDGKGDVLETPVVITSETFPNAIREILGAGTDVIEGTLYSVPGTYSGTHVFESKRKAVDFICKSKNAEWRVNNRAELDAGLAEDLYNEVPDTVIVRRRPNRHTDGDDLTIHGLRGDMGVAEDVKDWTSKVILLAEGEGTAIATATATNPAVPYRDLRGQLVRRVRVISESTTAPGNAQARADYQLGKYVTPRAAMTLTTDDYDVSGAFAIGDWAYVYDPESGLVDPGVEVTFRGERLNPIRLRMVGASWPVRRGMTVAYRDKDGGWLDLTPYVQFEGGETTVTVGDLLRALSDGGVEPVGPRPIPDSTIPGVVSWDLPFESGVYLGSDGSTRARMLVRWDLPLNVDGSTILDGDHYEVQYAVSPAAGEWQTAYAPWGDLQAMVQDLTPGIDYDFRIRAVDSSGNQGAWSVTQTEQTNADTIAPSTPAPPSVAGSLIAVQITHTLGKSTGGTYNLELDLHHLEVHVGATAGFTADSTTLKGSVSARAGMIAAGIPAVGTVPVAETTARWVRVVAVDEAGNRSAASSAVTATAQLIDDAHISNLTVSKLLAGTLNADIVLGARIKTADTGQRVEMNTNGVQMFNAAGTQLVSLAPTGVFFLRSATTGARFDFSTVTGFQAFDAGGTRTVHLDVDGSFEIRSAASGSRIHLDGTGFYAYNSSNQQTVNIPASTGAPTFVGQISTGFSGNRIIFNPTGSPWPSIYFAPATGTNYASIQSQPATNNNVTMYAESSTDSITNDKSVYQVAPNFFYAAQMRSTSGGDYQSEMFLKNDEIRFNWRGIASSANDHNLTCTDAGWRVDGASIKSFVIDHPVHADRYLVHACTESPVPGVEYWGETVLDGDGCAVVELPGYFEALTKKDGRYVAVNTCSDGIRNASATYPQDGKFMIHGGPGLRVTWLVKAIRADADMVVEPRRDEIDVYGDGPYRYAIPKESRG